jgi:phage terminase large subunit-like protein
MLENLDDKKLAAAIARFNKLEKLDLFDPAIPGSKPTKVQKQFLSDFGKFKTRIIRAGNRSGKSATVAKEIADILNGQVERPKEWGDGPLLILLAGQDRKMMEIELWDKKIALFLDLKDWRQVRVGGSLQYAENKNTGDKIVFLSHSDSSEKNRKHMQGYTAHYVWLDEMPASIALLQEIRARALTYGYFVATFTPKFKSEEMRIVIDSIKEPHGKTYRFSMLDNPMFKGREDELFAELEGHSQAFKNAILYGDWYNGDSSVYEWLPDIMIEDPGETYTPAWRHVVAVDPALKSKCGFTLWAENPKTGVWYLVQDDYIEGIYDPEALFEAVEAKLAGYNVIRRISDTMAWFTGVASKHGKPYMTPYDKNSRKEELIKNLQVALSGQKIKIASWCKNFKAEIISCQWSETSDRIVNASSFHTLDSSQYFVDAKPKYELNHMISTSWHETLRRGNYERKKQEALLNKISHGGRLKPLKQWRSRNNNRGLKRV